MNVVPDSLHMAALRPYNLGIEYLITGYYEDRLWQALVYWGYVVLDSGLIQYSPRDGHLFQDFDTVRGTVLVRWSSGSWSRRVSGPRQAVKVVFG